MLSSLEEDLSELVLCSICIELLSDTRVLGCGHTFCLQCLQRYGSRKRPGDSLPCPMCRSDFEVPGGGFADLPRNFLLEKILEIHANALAALDSAVVVVVVDPVEKDDFRKPGRPQNRLTTSELQLQDDDNHVQNNMQQQQQQRNQRDDQQQPIRQRCNAVQRRQGVVEQQEQPQEHVQQEQREQQQQQQQPDQDQLQQEQRRERRRQQLQQRQQRRQLEWQQQQQIQRQLEQQEQRRWQFYRQRRRLSTLSCGCWSTRVIAISMALNFILAGNLWHTTERLEENEIDWSIKSNAYQTTINELIEEDAKKKDIIDSSELSCKNRVFLAGQRYEQDIKFYKAYLRTMMTALETAGRPKEETFSVLD